MANDSVSFLDKVKLLMWLNSLSKGEGKMGNMLAKLDGLKSVVGLLAMVAYYACPAFGGPKLPDAVLHIGSGIAGVGLLAKIEKGTGWLTVGITYAQKALDVLKAVVAAVAPQPPAK